VDIVEFILTILIIEKELSSDFYKIRVKNDI